MRRREFAKTCFMCAVTASAAPLLAGCQSTFYTAGTLEPNGISVSKSDFKFSKGEKEIIRRYILVRNDAMEFPIYVYRFSDDDYSALLMRCTHQGAELQASGDYLHCPSHGSEFNNRGLLSQGPAEKNLRSFKVLPDGEKIFIDLRS